jgi:predicted Fe-Mo cluster-binding NifX family protein
LDSRFGRAAKFLIFDADSGTFEVVDNRQSLEAVQGAGIQAAETIARAGPTAS